MSDCICTTGRDQFVVKGTKEYSSITDKNVLGVCLYRVNCVVFFFHVYLQFSSTASWPHRCWSETGAPTRCLRRQEQVKQLLESQSEFVCSHLQKRQLWISHPDGSVPEWRMKSLQLYSERRNLISLWQDETSKQTLCNLAAAALFKLCAILK